MQFHQDFGSPALGIRFQGNQSKLVNTRETQEFQLKGLGSLESYKCWQQIQLSLSSTAVKIPANFTATKGKSICQFSKTSYTEDQKFLIPQ